MQEFERQEVDDEEADAGGSSEGDAVGGMKIRWHVKVSALEQEYRACGIGLTTYIPLYLIQDM